MTVDPRPASLRRPREIDPSDAVALAGGSEPVTTPNVTERPIPALAGLLADYFTDREDVRRFIDDERSGWEE